MKKRRRRLLFGSLALAAVGLFGLTLSLPRHPTGPISEANCKRIADGMSVEEVEAILGGPPTSISYQDMTYTNYIVMGGKPPPAGSPPVRTDRCWAVVVSRGGIEDVPFIRVSFDAKGRVEGTECYPGRSATEQLKAMVDQWLRRLKLKK